MLLSPVSLVLTASYTRTSAQKYPLMNRAGGSGLKEAIQPFWKWSSRYRQKD